MIFYLINFYGKDNKLLFELRNSIRGRVLLINNDFIRSIVEMNTSLNISDVVFWDMFIKCENIEIIVDNYNLTDKVNLYKASDGEAHINLVKSKSSKLHFVGLKINLIQIFDSQILLGNCKITDFDIDIEGFMNELQNIGNERKYNNYSIDIRNTMIRNLSIYYSINHLNIQESSIHKLEFRSNKNNYGVVHIWNGSTLEFIRLNCDINNFKIEDSDVRKLYFTSVSKVHNFTINKSFIERVFGCDASVFDSKGIDVWKLLKKSSVNDNEELYYEACYKIAQIEGSKKNKVLDWFFRMSIGYGYKPRRAILFILCTILVFGFIYSLIDFIYYVINGSRLVFTLRFLQHTFNHLINRIYFSGITFTTTGYGDILPTNYVTKFFTVVEACLGVTMFSLLIYSLTKRHFDK